MALLGSVERVAARVGEPIETAEDIALANEMLEAASAWVRYYGRPWHSMDDAPSIAVAITVAAAARGYMNPSGFAKERSDAVNFERAGAYGAGVELTPDEIRVLKTLSGQGSIQSLPIHNPERFISRSDVARRGNALYVPIDDGSQAPLPLFEEGGWDTA